MIQFVTVKDVKKKRDLFGDKIIKGLYSFKYLFKIILMKNFNWKHPPVRSLFMNRDSELSQQAPAPYVKKKNV